MNDLTPGPVIEIIHGVEVRDPNRWLEDRALPHTDRWIRMQNRLCEQYFLQSKSYGPLRTIVSDALSVEIVDQAVRVGNKVFLKKRSGDQAHASIWVQLDGEREGSLLVDPRNLGTNVAVDILQITSDGALLAVGVRASGSDAMEVRIADVLSGDILPDHLPQAYLRGFRFDPLGRGFYYCVEPRFGVADHSIKYHRLGCPSNDTILFAIPSAEHRRLILLSCETAVGALVTEGAGATATQDLYLAQGCAESWKMIYQGRRGRWFPILSQGRLFLLDMEETRNGRLIELSDTGEFLRVVISESQNCIHKCFAIRTGFLVSYLTDRRLRIERWSIEGNLIGPLNLPSDGSIELLTQCLDQSSAAFFLHESYTHAPSLWEVDLSEQGAPQRWTAPRERIAAVVRESWYTSLDGTRIPIVLLEPTDKHLKSPRAAILFGYGGFGFAEQPRYSRLARILVTLGVTIARAGIRGGSEFGEAWHVAAMGRNKQRAIDDFLAAALWLSAEGLTDPDHLAIMGGSNGGLVVAAAATQRPSLFKAAICTGPLTDMVRYERFDHAYRWRAEFGTVEDPEEFRALLRYSPYHNIKEGFQYPAMLFVTGDADDRCNPAHVRKMVKSLQDLPDQKGPFITDYGEVWGHVGTLSLAERIEILTRKVAFICDQLGIVLPEGDANELPGVSELRIAGIR